MHRKFQQINKKYFKQKQTKKKSDTHSLTHTHTKKVCKSTTEIHLNLNNCPLVCLFLLPLISMCKWLLWLMLFSEQMRCLVCTAARSICQFISLNYFLFLPTSLFVFLCITKLNDSLHWLSLALAHSIT